ncbi:MAG: DeoR/GlpR transcriptional regulator [Eubacterium sp.]|nr:DeoR/GlpR transcriptional regulator [Eubacterium sp.]
MLTEERLQKIQELVEEKKSVSTQELMETLDISESTARRDLTVLASQGQISKVRGGAMAKTARYNTKDDTVSERKDKNLQEKHEIAKYAATLIEPNDFVYLDAGTTTELMIDYLTEKNVVFVTNAVSHARKLSQAGYTTYILGGEFKGTTEAIVGDEAVASLQKYNFTKGFWGTNGISQTEGFSTPDVKEAMIKKVSMSRCQNCYVLSDTSKFSQISCVKFAEFANADIITTKLSEDLGEVYEIYAGCDNVWEVNEL